MKTLEQILADSDFIAWFSKRHGKTPDEMSYWNEELLFPFYDQYQLDLRNPPQPSNDPRRGRNATYPGVTYVTDPNLTSSQIANAALANYQATGVYGMPSSIPTSPTPNRNYPESPNLSQPLRVDWANLGDWMERWHRWRDSFWDREQPPQNGQPTPPDYPPTPPEPEGRPPVPGLPYQGWKKPKETWW